MAEDALISRLRLADAGDEFVGNNQDVNWCLRGNVTEGKAVFVAEYYIGGDLPIADFLENRLHCGRSLAEARLSGKLEKIPVAGDSCSSALREVHPMA